MWSTSESRAVYENAWIRVREDQVRRPDGTRGIYGVVEVRSPAVFVVAVTDDDEILLVTLHRYTTGRSSIEVPSGGSDGEDLLVAARRELREESGYEAAQWRALGEVQSLNGVAAAPGRVFLATGLTLVGGAELETEGIETVRAVPVAEVVAMVGRGEITDNETLGALLLGLVALGRVS
ncbi:NUDIX hydrolase [Microlunatus spumicola]|uniref:NUDIX hydrolase n=1 Tax=Microlunatus spumicola TaxID=81499 RepID=A0ABP6X283_9ACTN